MNGLLYPQHPIIIDLILHHRHSLSPPPPWWPLSLSPAPPPSPTTAGTKVESGEDEGEEGSGSDVECDLVEDKAKSKDESPPEAETKGEIVKLGDPSSPLIDSGEDESSLGTDEEFELEEDGAIDGKDGVSVEAISSSFPLVCSRIVNFDNVSPSFFPSENVWDMIMDKEKGDLPSGMDGVIPKVAKGEAFVDVHNVLDKMPKQDPHNVFLVSDSGNVWEGQFFDNVCVKGSKEGDAKGGFYWVFIGSSIFIYSFIALLSGELRCRGGFMLVEKWSITLICLERGTGHGVWMYSLLPLYMLLG
ncbi:hypothetical protein U1Q18_017926 [Sarracenia purpurea var. burkii]